MLIYETLLYFVYFLIILWKNFVFVEKLLLVIDLEVLYSATY